MSNAEHSIRDSINSSVGGENISAQKTAQSSLSNLGLDVAFSNKPDLVCLSHLRWDFVYQRPQHLLSRFAKDQRVFFIEEPIFSPEASGQLDISSRESGVWVVVPQLREGLSPEDVEAALKEMLDDLFAQAQIDKYILWYYTPMAIGFTNHLEPLITVYDCMDELSAFRGASPTLKARENELFDRAKLVFTGGQSLYEAKRDRHPNVYAFPSSIDRAHFAQCRNVADKPSLEEPADQVNIPHPRLGFFGVIDERMDIELLGGIAQARPDWHLVIVGPVVKIDPADLPRHPNLHYLGGKSYQELPAYIAGWDIAMLPFALNESTRFISPTKTPEYLAAGKPVVSTSIRDVVRPYGENGLVEIADTVTDFVNAAQTLMNRDPQESGWLDQVDAFLVNTSWDSTWGRMVQLIEEAIAQTNQPASLEDELLTNTAKQTAVSTPASGKASDLLTLE